MIRQISLIALLILLLGVTLIPPVQAATDLRIENGHFFARNSAPFFYLGDTAWELIHTRTREDVDTYLTNRAELGFTVIHTVALSEFEGLDVPNAYGDLPLLNRNPSSPATTPGNNPQDDDEYDYWDHLDYIVDQAEQLDLYVGLLPTWGRWVADEEWRIFDSVNAESYGQFLGTRYREKPIIWILGGDRGVNDDTQRNIWRAMARGIAIGAAGTEDYSQVFMTYHPSSGGSGSAVFFHDEEWLDFNLNQGGHWTPNRDIYTLIAHDYALTPTKPTLEGEPNYEDHPIAWEVENGFFSDYDVRKAAYWSLFAGAAGYTYGNHNVWHFTTFVNNNPWTFLWPDALNRPGATQVGFAKALLLSRPYFSRIPDQTVLVNPGGSAEDYKIASRDEAGSYLFAYTPLGTPLTINMNTINGPIRAYWFDPRQGTSTLIGDFTNTGTHNFVPPTSGENNDWILVLDAIEANYPPPGEQTTV